MVVQACDPSAQEVEAAGQEFKFSIQHKPTIGKKKKNTRRPQINQDPEKDQVQGQSWLKLQESGCRIQQE